jgi:hypothetical protein
LSYKLQTAFGLLNLLSFFSNVENNIQDQDPTSAKRSAYQSKPTQALSSRGPGAVHIIAPIADIMDKTPVLASLGRRSESDVNGPSSRSADSSSPSIAESDSGSTTTSTTNNKSVAQLFRRAAPAFCSASPSNLPLKVAPPKPSRVLASDSNSTTGNVGDSAHNNNDGGNKRRKSQHDTASSASSSSSVCNKDWRAMTFTDDGSMDTYFQVVRRASLRRANTNIDYLHDDLFLCILSFLVDSGGKFACLSLIDGHCCLLDYFLPSMHCCISASQRTRRSLCILNALLCDT